jgi:cell division protease FtsH
MAGQVAESMVFDELSTGASNDIERATAVARRMVTEFGMSESLGPLAFGKKDELVFLGREISEQRNYSDEIAYQIDREIRMLIDRAHEKARAIISEHFDRLEAIAKLLVDKETIEHEELEELFDGPRPAPTLVGPPISQPAARSKQDESEGRDFPGSGRLTPQPAG